MAKLNLDTPVTDQRLEANGDELLVFIRRRPEPGVPPQTEVYPINGEIVERITAISNVIGPPLVNQPVAGPFHVYAQHHGGDVVTYDPATEHVHMYRAVLKADAGEQAARSQAVPSRLVPADSCGQPLQDGYVSSNGRYVVFRTNFSYRGEMGHILIRDHATGMWSDPIPTGLGGPLLAWAP